MLITDYKDCEKCAICGKERDEQHDWNGCKCSKCGKTRDEQHDWSKNCEKCSKCGKSNNNQHNWSKDCEKCSKCGKTRDAQHDWSKNCEKCSKCGKPNNNQHNWSKDCEKCSKCGITRDDEHDWSKNCEQCSKCGKSNNNQHNWIGCKCDRCSKIRDEQHDWDYDNCSKCGKTREQVTFVHDENRPHPAAPHIKITKKIYKSQSKEAALQFLEKQNVTVPFYYIEIDTPFGRFGIDNGRRIYDNKGRFIEPETKPLGVTYDKETTDLKAFMEKAMQNKERELPKEFMQKKESVLRCLQLIIEDASADFYLRRMAIWWGSQFNDDAFNTFLKKRFVDGKDRVSLYQKTESSQSEVARAEEGLYIASVDVLSGSWKP